MQVCLVAQDGDARETVQRRMTASFDHLTLMGDLTFWDESFAADVKSLHRSEV